MEFPWLFFSDLGTPKGCNTIIFQNFQWLSFVLSGISRVRVTNLKLSSDVSKKMPTPPGNTLDFFYKQLRICLELGLVNSETEIGTGVA